MTTSVRTQTCELLSGRAHLRTRSVPYSDNVIILLADTVLETPLLLEVLLIGSFGHVQAQTCPIVSSPSCIVLYFLSQFNEISLPHYCH